MKRLLGVWFTLLVLVMIGFAQSGRVAASALPADAYSVSYDPPMKSGSGMVVSVDLTKNSAGRSVYTVSLLNQSARSANFVLPLGGSMVVAEGTVYRLQAAIQMSGGIRPMQVNVGYQLLRSDGSYQADWAPASGQYLLAVGAAQILSTEYLGGDVNAVGGGVPAKLQSRLVVFNIPAGRSVSLTMELMQLDPRGVSGQAEVAGWSNMPAAVAPGAKLPMDVGVRLVPGGKTYRSALSLQSGSTVYRYEQQVVAAASRWATVQDGWNFSVPAGATQGVYDVWYELPDVGVKQRLGGVSVVAPAGMALGFGVHRYPGTSESSLGGMVGDYQFARSLASDQLYLTQWWLGPDRYDWNAIDQWAAYHAADGSRRLMLTFSGSPRWASASPDQASAMGAAGNAAPPKASYRDAYARMVAATVARLKGRLLAVECWNEPDVPSFFSGTQTDLADLCQAVSEQAKAQDAQVKVICPQPTDPVALDWVYAAKTSAGTPIDRYCDWVGSHVYNRMGKDASGRDYVRDAGVDQAIAAIRGVNRRYGIDKPIAVTEFGVSSCVVRPSSAHPVVFGSMGSSDASEALYQSIRAFRQEGVVALGLYSYDHGVTDASCVPGGSYVRATVVGADKQQRLDTVVLGRVTQAVKDFGQHD